MSIEEIRTFKDIQDAIIIRAKINDNAENRNQVKEKINIKYQEVSNEKPYKWTGVTRQFLLPVRYTTGTIAVTKGSRNITGTATVWTSLDHQGCKIYIQGESIPYKILRVDDAAQTAVLDQKFLGDNNATASYTIFRDEFGLFPDFREIRSFTIPGVTHQIYPTGTDVLDREREGSPFTTGLPRCYTVSGENHYHRTTWADFLIDTDFWEDPYTDPARNQNLIVWPGIRTVDRLATIRYSKIVPPLMVDDDEPLIPYSTRAVLVYGSLFEHFLQNRDNVTQREWERQYLSCKKRMEAEMDIVSDEMKLIVDRRPYRWESDVSFAYKNGDE